MSRNCSRLFLTMLLFALLSVLAIPAFADEIRSARSYPGLNQLPPPLKQLLLSLGPAEVAPKLQPFFQARHIPITIHWRRDDGSFDGQEMGAKVVQPRYFPITTMAVSYEWRGADYSYYYQADPNFDISTAKDRDEIRRNITEETSPHHELYLRYRCTPHSGGAGIAINYWPAGYDPLRRRHILERMIASLEVPEFSVGFETRTVLINGATVHARISAARLFDNFNPATSSTSVRSEPVLTDAIFLYGPFIVRVYTEIKDWEGFWYPGAFLYWDQSYWVRHVWPEKLAEISEEVNALRDIQPLLEQVISRVKAVADALPAVAPAAVRAAPENPRLEAQFSQVLDDPGFLVHAKPALIAIRLKWDNAACVEVPARVTWTRNGKAERTIDFTFKHDYSWQETRDGRDGVLIPFLPDVHAHPRERRRVEVTLKEIKDTAGRPLVLSREMNTEVRSFGDPVINIVFVPIGVDGWETGAIYRNQGRRLDRRLFAAFREKQLSFMRGLYPLPLSAIRDVTASDLMLEVEPSLVERHLTDVTRRGLLRRLEDYYEASRRQGVDYVVAIVPSGWMSDMGVTEAPFPHSVIIDQYATGSVLAHEIGHLLGFDHNEKAYGHSLQSDAGYWIRSVQPAGLMRMLPSKQNVTTVDFMNEDPIDATNTWICRENHERLRERLRAVFGAAITTAR